MSEALALSKRQAEEQKEPAKKKRPLVFTTKAPQKKELAAPSNDDCCSRGAVAKGAAVIIQKYDGTKASGKVAAVITTSARDERGIKVQLKSGVIGRVWRIEQAAVASHMACPMCGKKFLREKLDKHLRLVHAIL